MQQTVIHFVAQAGWVQALVAGAFLGIGFIVPALWWLGVVALIWSLYFVRKATTYRHLILVQFIIWWIKSICSLSWYVSTYPIEWIDIPNQLHQIILIVLYWCTSSAWLALGGVALAIIGRFLYVQKGISKSLWYSLMPAVWLLSELVSGGTFAIFSFGPGSIVDSYFVSLGMVGYLLGTTSLGVWLAFVGGVYGLSFIVVSAASFILLLVQAKKVKSLVLFLFVICIVGIWCNQRQLPYLKNNVTVISIDTQLEAALLNSLDGEQVKINTVRTAVDHAVGVSPAVIVLPEDSRYLQSQFNSLYPDQAMSMFLFTHQNTETILIDSGRQETDNGMTVLRANVFDGVSKKIWQFDKQYLVPQGEYMPYLYQVLFTMLGFKSEIAVIGQDSAYRPGPLVQTASLPAYIPGVLFCFESISPTGVPKLEQSRTLPFVAHPISHAWFHNPVILWSQLDVMLQLQARYSGVPIVSAGNMAVGKLYLPNGVIETGKVIGEGDRYQLREFIF